MLTPESSHITSRIQIQSNRTLVWVWRKRQTCRDCLGASSSDRRRWSCPSNWLYKASPRWELLLQPPTCSIDLVENIVSHLPSFFIHLSSTPLASFLPLSTQPRPLLSFHSANQPFLLSPSLLFFLSSSSTYSTIEDLSQIFQTDGWWWMVRQTRALFLPLRCFPSLFPPIFHMFLTLFSLMHFWG